MKRRKVKQNLGKIAVSNRPPAGGVGGTPT
jgi:hypothetical protein